jgi:Tfp pilus assembly major pilin PilA
MTKYVRHRHTEELTLVSSGNRTASGNSAEFDVSDYSEAIFFLDVTAVPGVYTDETLDVTVKTKDPASGKWFTIATFTQVTNSTTSEMKAVANNLGRKIRVEWAIGGTAPSYTFSVGAVLKD